MKIKVNGTSVNIVSPSSDIPQNKTPIIFLHGFTGAASDWDFIMQKINEKYFPIAADLPGHGETELSDDINDYTIKSINTNISSIIKKLNISEVVLLGYSMGGRAALSYASKHPSVIKALILESTTAGLKNAEEKKQRMLSDEKLAEKIEKIGVEKFMQQWLDQPLFESLNRLSQSEYQKILKKKYANNARGLANSLRGFGTGTMRSQWNKLSDLKFPVLLITGGLDNKYETIASRMTKLLTVSEHETLPNTGHNAHLEKPKEFIKLVNNFLEKL